MKDNNFKIRMVLILVTMVVMAMLLQSIVIIFLGMRSSIREDVAWARKTLQSEAISVHVRLKVEKSGKRGRN